MIECNVCNGQGQLHLYGGRNEPCPMCDGAGSIFKHEADPNGERAIERGGVEYILRSEAAAIVERTINLFPDATNRDRMLLSIAARAVRRGRQLTDKERAVNFRKMLGETSS